MATTPNLNETTLQIFEKLHNASPDDVNKLLKQRITVPATITDELGIRASVQGASATVSVMSIVNALLRTCGDGRVLVRHYAEDEEQIGYALATDKRPVVKSTQAV